MKTSLITLAFTLVSSLVLAQTASENYVKSTSYRVETTDGIFKKASIIPLTDDDKIETISYFDGLGRVKQTIAKQAGGNKEHIVTPVVYDHIGRQEKNYLPTITMLTGSNALNFLDQTNLILNQENYYKSKYTEENWATLSDVNAYSQKRFEQSPLNRVMEQGAPGADWRVDTGADTDHTIKFNYQTNSSRVEFFKVNFPTLDTEQPQLYYAGEYQAHELYKMVTKDENWQPNQTYPKAHTTEEFTNTKGQVILKRTYDSKAIAHNTHYVYDDFGNLTYVLTPKGIDLLLKSTSYKSFTDLAKYDVFIPTDKFGKPITGGDGTVEVTVNAMSNTIKVAFDIRFNTAIDLKNGAIFKLSETIPNMIIGTIANGSYTVSIQDGFLFVAGSGNVTSVEESIDAILPSNIISLTILDDLCYQYHYDDKNRLIEKKIPQKGWEYIIYDKLDRPILTQDAYLRNQNPKLWLFTRYDKFDRVAYTGTYSSTATRKSLQNTSNNQQAYDQSVNSIGSPITVDGTAIYYSNDVFPVSPSLVLHTVNYYDGYNSSLTNAFSNPSSVFSQTITNNTIGLATGSLVRVLGTSDWITSVSYYDDKGQPVFAGSENAYLNTTDSSKSEIDFSGVPTKIEVYHKKGSNAAIIATDRYTYDHANRMKTQKHQITGEAEQLIVKNTYDELGQLEEKAVGNTEASPLQHVDYTYNIRGWLTHINDPVAIGNDLFAFKINYNTTELNQGNAQLFNGNISETLWKTANDAAGTSRGYAYEYDALNRIESAGMAINTGSGYAQANGYHLSGLKYDKNGNIMSLKRTGQTAVFDDLIYTYSGNQLTKVKDLVSNQQNEGFIDGNSTGNDYIYDDNGNMIEDKNKDISLIVYNHLNLPTNIYVAGTQSGVIHYVYDATGVKLSKQVVDASNGTTTTVYAGNYIYEQVGSNEELKFFSHPEGYIEPYGSGEGSGYNYIFQYKDHLGNIRLSYTDSNSNGSVNASEVLEENNYYPFGLKHKGYNNVVTSTNPALKKTYNGKELQDELGLDWYDYGARNYDASLGRFMNIDRFSEKYEHMTPYQYTFNNPIRFIDVNGDYVFVGIMDDNGDQVNSVLYENGKAYNYTKDKNGNITKGDLFDGDVDFVDKAVNTLSKLEGSGKTGSDLVRYFSGSKYNVTIQKGKKNQETNEIVSLNLNDKTLTPTAEGVIGSDFYISLGHELAHRRDKNTRGYQATNSLWYMDGSDKITDSEIYATHIENMIRAESGIPLRTHYGVGADIINGELTLYGDEKSRIIDLKGNSRYYGSDGNRVSPNPGISKDVYGGEIYKNRLNYNKKE
ncbi:DUF6443 domain-containing protein [uncultured Psychroserpens sp.]|uniref:DUF6443 domain-containing protein n=1 Tax=uncultured Psychroserpens sp. TaxID=255436 RepID=UPI002637D859|nr:DUF6443 domain-containing protein [uncultured Psychroserpens sp.]